MNGTDQSFARRPKDRFIDVLRRCGEGPTGIEPLKRIGGSCRECPPQWRVRADLNERVGKRGAVARWDDPAHPGRSHDIGDFANVSRNDRKAEGERDHENPALRSLDIGKRHDIGVGQKLSEFEIRDETVTKFECFRRQNGDASLRGIIAATGHDNAQRGEARERQLGGLDEILQSFVLVDSSEEENAEEPVLRSRHLIALRETRSNR